MPWVLLSRNTGPLETAIASNSIIKLAKLCYLPPLDLWQAYLSLSSIRRCSQAPEACSRPAPALTEALLIKATADLMRLPQAAVGSALVFLHRFHTAPPKLDIPEQVSLLQGGVAHKICVACC